MGIWIYEYILYWYIDIKTQLSPETLEAHDITDMGTLNGTESLSD